MYKAINTIPFHKAMDLLYHSYEKPTKHLLLEPFCSVARLCLLSYKESKTKISIVNNGISYHSPHFSQGFLRSWYGDNREDLHNLYYPLTYFIQWYPQTDHRYSLLYEECQKGIRTLRSVYENNSTIHHTLTHYLKLLREGNVDRGDDSFVENSPTTDKEDTFTDASDTDTNPIIHKLQHLWTHQEQTLLLHLLYMISIAPSQSDSEDTSLTMYLKLCEDLLSHKESQVYQYIHTVTTEY